MSTLSSGADYLGVGAHISRQTRFTSAVSIDLLLVLDHGPGNGSWARVFVECNLSEVVEEKVKLPDWIPEGLESGLQAHLCTITNADGKEGGRAVWWTEGVVPGSAIGLGERGSGTVDRYVFSREDNLCSQLGGQRDSTVFGEIKPDGELLDCVGVSGRGI